MPYCQFLSSYSACVNSVKDNTLLVSRVFCLWATKKIFSAVLRMNLNSHINHGEAVYIINSVGIAYYQHGVLYIIVAKENTAFG